MVMAAPQQLGAFGLECRLGAADAMGVRSAFVVAQEGGYYLLYDHEAENFVRAFKHDDGWLKVWGIRGDATSTFLAR